MFGITHALIGASFAKAAGLNTASLVAAGVGGLVPDLDHPGSFLYQRVAPLFITATALGLLGWRGLATKDLWVLLPGAVLLILPLLGHRGITHSLLGLALSSAGVFLVFRPYALGFSLGYFLHLVADAFTPSGVPFFWPYPQRYGVPLSYAASKVLELVALGTAILIYLRP